MKTKLISLLLLFTCFVVAQQQAMMPAADNQEMASLNLSGKEKKEQKSIHTPENLCPDCLETTLGIEVIPEGNPGTALSKFPGNSISVSYSHEGCFAYQDPYYEQAHFNVITHPTLVNVSDANVVYPLFDINVPNSQDPHFREWSQAMEWETTCWNNPAADEFIIPCNIIPGEYKLKIKFIMSGCGGTFIYCQYPFYVDVSCTDETGTLLTYEYGGVAGSVVEHEMENLRTVIILENNSPVFENTTINCGTTLEIQIGETTTFDVVASDGDVTDEVTLRSGVLPSGAVLTPELPVTGNSASTTFSWTPLSGQEGDYSISFSSQDNAICPNITTCTITIRVLPPPPPLNVCIIKYFDENHNQSLEQTEAVMENVDFEMIKDDVPFTHYSGTTNSEGKLCFSHLEPGTYFIREFLPDGYTYSSPATGTMTITLPGDEGDIIWLNQAANNNNYYRTATYMDWATGGMNPRVKKSEKCKAKTVRFKFVLQIPSDVNGVKISFTNMSSSGSIYKGTTKQEVLNTWTNSRSAVYLGVLTPGEYIQIDGMGNRGLVIKVDYEWHSISADKYLTKSKVETFLENKLLLPMPNLHNIGEQLFAQEAFPAGLKIGTKKLTNGAHSVHHIKYSAVQKSLFDRELFHTGTPQCLSMIKNGKEYFSKQHRYLSPKKHSNALFGELLALKLNIAASDLGKFPVGLKELMYDNHKTSPGPFDGKYIGEIVNQADIFMTCNGDPKGTTAQEYYTVIKNINEAFNGPIDTISWNCNKVVMTGVLQLKDVPYLRAEPGAIPPFQEFSGDGVTEESPSSFSIHNYPNPFNPTTMIAFELPEDALVTLKVFDVLGREIATLANSEQYEAGSYELEFDASTLANGIYFYRITAQSDPSTGDAARHGAESTHSGQSFVDVKKMLLAK